MHLSKRLETIANMIPKGSHIIDVGCDHGLLSIYLVLEKECTALATDINTKALDNAINNIRKYKVDIPTKCTDGINDININPDDYLVIAGMGTQTIMHILENKILPDNLVISSNNQLYTLRKYVTKLGYIIDDEKFVEERNKKYVIIKFIKGHKKYHQLDLKYGPIAQKDMNYLIYELNKLFVIKEELQNSNWYTRYKNKKEINALEKLITKIKG